MPTTQGGRWSFKTGEKGANRVRAFQRGSRLYLEWRNGKRKVRQQLPHADRTQAKAEAEAKALGLRSPDRDAPLTVQVLFERYVEEVTPGKSERARQHDHLMAALCRRVFGPNHDVASLTHRDAKHFERERRRIGDLRPRKPPRRGESPAPPRPVRNRQIGYDLHLLRAVLNWAVGAGWLTHNPLAKYHPPTEKNPRRPVFSEAEYQKLLAVADTFPPAFRVLLVLANETGHRLGALLALRWSDVDLTAGRVTWRATSDKIGYEHTTRLTEAAKAVLLAAPGIGDALVVPGVSRHLARDWMERAQRRAGLAVEHGRGWHAFRRKFASELQDAPLRVLCDLGGWKDPATIVRCYQRPDEAAQEDALARRRTRVG